MPSQGRASETGITRHTVDTPYPVGPVHIYTCELAGNLVLFDTGPPTETGKRYLRKNIDLARLKYVFITHSHPDHCGLMEFIENESDALILLSKYDAFKYENAELRIDVMTSIFKRLGFPPEGLMREREKIEWFQKSLPVAKNYALVEESAELMEPLGLSCLRCPGHSQSDIVYLIDCCAVTGDVLLRDIFQAPLLDVDFDSLSGRFRNYDAYCDTITKMKSFENLTIYPAHREYVDSVDERVTYYVKKILERSRIAEPLLASGKSVYDTVASLFGRYMAEPFTIYIKTSEIAFISDFLDTPETLITALVNNGLYEGLKEDFKAAGVAL